jgi:hypothetical protein
VDEKKQHGGLRNPRGGRPPKRPEERRVQISVRVAPECIPLLDALAAGLGLTHSAVLEEGVRALAARHPDLAARSMAAPIT